jgi:hypothetical protein
MREISAEFAAIQKAERTFFPECLAFGSIAKCAAQPIRSHSIQRNGSLDSISENGHVYQFGPGRAPVPLWEFPTRISIRKASTFPGFCQEHDRSIFEGLEKSFDSRNLGHLTALFYRAVCIEFQKKQFSLHSFRTLEDQVSEDRKPFFQAVIEGTLKGLEDIGRIRAICEKAMDGGIPLPLVGVFFEFSRRMPFTFTGGFAPIYDFLGRRNLPRSATFNDWGGVFTFAGQISGRSVFFAAGVNGTGAQDIEEFFGSLKNYDPSLYSAFVLNLGLTHLENTFFQISWYDGLSNREKSFIKSKLREGGNFGPMNQYALIPEVKLHTSNHVSTTILGGFDWR